MAPNGSLCEWGHRLGGWDEYENIIECQKCLKIVPKCWFWPYNPFRSKLN